MKQRTAPPSGASSRRDSQPQAASFVRVHGAVTRALAAASTLHDAALGVATAIASHSADLGWTKCEVWYVDAAQDLLRHAIGDLAPGMVPGALAAGTARRGEGVPGRVWAEGQSSWVNGLGSPDGLRSACAVPIVCHGAVLGVLAVYSDEPRDRDDDLVAFLEAIGSQAGQAFAPVRDRDGRKEWPARGPGDAVAPHLAEEGLRRSEQRLRLALDAARMVAWEYDPATLEVTLSDNVEEVLELPRRHKDSREGYTLIHPDDVARHRALVDAAIANGGSYVSEYRHAHGAEDIWLEEHGRAVVDRSGQTCALVGVVQNVTERKRTEEALLASHDRLKKIVEVETVGVMFWDLTTGLTTNANDAFLKMMGYSRDDVAAGTLTWQALTPPEYVDASLAELKNFEATGRVGPYEKEYFRKDGSRQWLLFAGSSIGDQACVEFCVDIADRKKAEAALQAQQRLYQSVTDNASLALLIMDERQHCIFMNPAAEHLTGFTFDEVQGRPLHDVIHHTRPDGRHFPLEECAIDRAFPNNDREKGEEVFVHKDGHFYPVAFTASPLRDASRRPVGTIIEVEDITNRRKLEAERERSLLALQDADRRKDQCLATLAHELRNPLAPLRTGVQLVKLAGATGRTADQALAAMERQIDHIVRLVDDLLDMSRISRGKISLRQERLSLALVVQQATDTIRETAEGRRHRLTIDLPSEPLYVFGDSVRLAQVVGNLLHNAVKYTEPAGHITVEVRRDGAAGVVSVRDTGAGIPAEMQERVFEMFTQVDDSPERRHGGLGIGLWLARQLVTLHGGTITVVSAGVGRGSDFIVRLPLAVSAAESAADSSAEGAAAPHSLRILVVDDNHDAAVTLGALLDLVGHQTQVVHDGQAALDAAAAFRPDVVLLDLGMPGMNGFEVARGLRQDSSSAAIFIVAVTGWGADSDRRRTREAGFDEHLVKPVDAIRLQRVLAGVRAARP